MSLEQNYTAMLGSVHSVFWVNEIRDLESQSYLLTHAKTRLLVRELVRTPASLSRLKASNR